MEDPKVLFADTTARRAELMKATERFKSSIQNSVESIKTDATENGKTIALVAGVALGVFIIANAILPKSAEYRYAEKYGERDDEDDYEARYASYEEYDGDQDDMQEARNKSKRQLVKENKETTRKSALGGLIGGLVTSVLTNVAREQLSHVLARVRSNNAINPGASPSTTEQYHQKAPTQPVSYASQV
ncbi:MAG: hypothetical protein EAZ91_18550 [Cytophagales bacterium]|nr:MAG: hypothetical protein EAZ91_18550 [Cytophagales bacterium]